MKQIIQSLKSGETEIADVPAPKVTVGTLLISTSQSLVSAGTERMLVEFGKANLLNKARQQPDKVRQVLDKVRTDGLFTTYEAVTSKLDQPLPLGYCNVGTVLEVGAGVEGFEVGDRVASNGYHAEVVRVPQNLCARIPDEVNDESASYTVIGSIALQGIRLFEPTLGEAVVVMGLGLVGLMTVQLLKANGCRVLGLDFDPAKCALAQKFGAETLQLGEGADPVATAMAFSRGRGVDGVIIAAATDSDEPMHQAALMTRKRGRVILVGVVGLNLSRDDFFKKEIRFQVSASYGPGRYDPTYEDKGQDYPVGFVRWTEQRNFEALLDMMAGGHITPKALTTHTFDLGEAKDAYALLGSKEPYLGILLKYPENADASQQRVISIAPQSKSAAPSKGRAAFIGVGNYASRVLIPAFKAGGAHLDTVVSSGGLSSVHHGKKLGFDKAATDVDGVFKSNDIDTIVIATPHNSHADYVRRALESGKHVFVEKPLAITLAELDDVQKAHEIAKTKPLVMVGFNRRFAPMVQKMKSLVDKTGRAKAINITVNAGAIPAEHWTQQMGVGGGRIIGEGCHFIDLARHLAGAPIVAQYIQTMGPMSGEEVTSDKAVISLSFADGSIATIQYLANGGKAFPKERIEVFCNDGVLQLNNYRILIGFGWRGFKSMKSVKQDKGQNACANAFMDAVKNGGEAPIPFEEIMEVSRVSVELATAGKSSL